jgi:hypothetical protein
LDALGGEHFGDFGADALYVHDRSVDGGHMLDAKWRKSGGTNRSPVWCLEDWGEDRAVESVSADLSNDARRAVESHVEWKTGWESCWPVVNRNFYKS